MAKYKSMGDPLIMLSEECTEVIKEVCKAKRFGLEGDEGYMTGDKISPRERLIQEVGDVLTVIEILIQRRVFTQQELAKATERKRVRLRECFADYDG